MDLGLAGRVALVSGGSGYVGRAVAAALRDEGAVVVLAGRDEDRLERAVADLDAGTDRITAVTMDTRDEASVDAAVGYVVREHGRLDVLVNTAAPPAGTLDPARDHDAAQVLDAIDGKAMGYLRTTDAALPHMRAAGHGRIVQVSGQNAQFTASVTSSARNAVVSVASKTIADELAGTGVTVNVVDPGLITDTPSTAVQPARAGESTPQQVAAAVVFLASEQAAAISGVSLAVGHRAYGVQ
ncbi:dehydrogenase [Agromyces rhizosphaerae]|uniref:Dehydrogenase n=1 Tax=Agromyces rhizosphaerae TaxID=88374 RepID=A0A9W6CX42_9MICO|nr:SDR family NAD(P)-dependent oxidoreductase [Agromyces rhizosphaerae]GLI26919.1 dehydrogenase [Agromyces rhizosphaerae]